MIYSFRLEFQLLFLHQPLLQVKFVYHHLAGESQLLLGAGEHLKSKLEMYNETNETKLIPFTK